MRKILNQHRGELVVDITRSDLKPYIEQIEYESLSMLVHSKEPIFKGLARYITEKAEYSFAYFFDYLQKYFFRTYFDSLRYLSSRHRHIIQIDERKLEIILDIETENILEILAKKWHLWATEPLD